MGKRNTNASARPLSASLRLQRGEVGARRQEIFRAEMGNDGSHKRCPKPVPVAALHVIELPYEVARRTSRKRWHRAKSAQITTVADHARRDFATVRRDAAHDQRLALLDAAGRHIRDEARS